MRISTPTVAKYNVYRIGKWFIFMINYYYIFEVLNQKGDKQNNFKGTPGKVSSF